MRDGGRFVRIVTRRAAAIGESISTVARICSTTLHVERDSVDDKIEQSKTRAFRRRAVPGEALPGARFPRIGAPSARRTRLRAAFRCSRESTSAACAARARRSPGRRPRSCLRSSRASAAHELVAESMNGPDQRRQLPGLFDLGAQAMDVHVDRSLVTVEIEAPDALEQPVARERDAGVSRELRSAARTRAA